MAVVDLVGDGGLIRSRYHRLVVDWVRDYFLVRRLGMRGSAMSIEYPVLY